MIYPPAAAPSSRQAAGAEAAVSSWPRRWPDPAEPSRTVSSPFEFFSVSSVCQMCAWGGRHGNQQTGLVGFYGRFIRSRCVFFFPPRISCSRSVTGPAVVEGRLSREQNLRDAIGDCSCPGAKHRVRARRHRPRRPPGCLSEAPSPQTSLGCFSIINPPPGKRARTPVLDQFRRQHDPSIVTEFAQLISLTKGVIIRR